MMQINHFSLNCGGRLVDLSTPALMGILNITPDSFYEGSRFQALESALPQVEKFLSAGATFIDIGGHSTRPGAEAVSETEEMTRVLPMIQGILKAFPQALISIDTFRASVAKASIEAGAVMVNDISGGNLDTKMFETVAALQVPYVLMHSRGTPQTMQSLNQYDEIGRASCRERVLNLV